MTSVELETLISSLGDTTPDAFYLVCAYAPIEQVRARLRQQPPQEHLHLGLRAAFISQRADAVKLLLDQGANVEPLIATIGLEAAQAYVVQGQEALESQHVTSSPLTLSFPERSSREQNDLRLAWIQLKPTNRTLCAIAEGVENQRPTVVHLQAHDTNFSPHQRIAWMQFDLARSPTHLDRIADIRNVQGTPLHWSVDNHADVEKNREILAFLLARGADPYTKTRWNQTAREMCLEQLQQPNDVLSSQRREFYLYAADELSKAEQKFARGSQSTSVFSKVKFVLRWPS